MAKKSYQQFLIPLLIIIVGGGFGAYAAMQQKTPVGHLAAVSDEPSNVNVSTDDDPVLGNQNAPVTIIEFSDFQCPYCKDFHDTSFPTLKTKYIDTGKAKFVYRDFPLGQHSFAEKAAEAADCASAQGKFWEMHDMLFAHQNALTVENLKQYAGTLGLNSTTFNTCLDSGKYAAEIKKDYNDGVTAGVKSTPTFYINGQQVTGAQPVTAFEQTIESAHK